MEKKINLTFGENKQTRFTLTTAGECTVKIGKEDEHKQSDMIKFANVLIITLGEVKKTFRCTIEVCADGRLGVRNWSVLGHSDDIRKIIEGKLYAAPRATRGVDLDKIRISKTGEGLTDYRTPEFAAGSITAQPAAPSRKRFGKAAEYAFSVLLFALGTWCSVCMLGMMFSVSLHTQYGSLPQYMKFVTGLGAVMCGQFIHQLVKYVVRNNKQ